MSRRRIVVAIVGVFLIFLLAPQAFAWYSTEVEGKQRIKTAAEWASSNQTSVRETVERIVEWELADMTWDTKQIQLWPFPPFLLLRQSPSPEWIITTRRGGCGEFAILFTGIAKAAGIESRVVRNDGEDHMWAEALIDGQWTHVDPTLAVERGIDNPHLYETPVSEKGWGKQLSRVVAYYENGTETDVTSTYTETGRLIVRVVLDGVPVTNATVVVQSRFLMEHNPHYNAPRECAVARTNQSGLAFFDLGENNYTVTAEIGNVIGNRDERIITLKETESSTIELNPSGPAWLWPPYVLWMLGILLVEIVFLLVVAKYKNRIREWLGKTTVMKHTNQFNNKQ